MESFRACEVAPLEVKCRDLQILKHVRNEEFAESVPR